MSVLPITHHAPRMCNVGVQIQTRVLSSKDRPLHEEHCEAAIHVVSRQIDVDLCRESWSYDPYLDVEVMAVRSSLPQPQPSPQSSIFLSRQRWLDFLCELESWHYFYEDMIRWLHSCCSKGALPVCR
jgi:hypothetical protein